VWFSALHDGVWLSTNKTITYLLTYLLTDLLTFLLTYLLTYLLSYLLTYLLIYLLTYFLSYLLTYLLTYLVWAIIDYGDIVLRTQRVSLWPTANNRWSRHYAVWLCARLSVRPCESVNTYFACRDTGVLSGGISVKPSTDIHHVSGNCWNLVQLSSSSKGQMCTHVQILHVMTESCISMT